MTIARQFNLLSVTVAAAVCIALTLFTAQREYQLSLDNFASESRALVLSRPHLQYLLYSADEAALSDELRQFLAKSSSSFVTMAFEATGTLLARSGTLGDNPPYLAELRGQLSANETGLRSLGADRLPQDTGFWQTLFGNRAPIYLSVPVLSATDPTAKNLSPADFARALFDADSQRSEVVMGYIAIGLDRGAILSDAMNRAGQVFLVAAIVLAIGLLLLQFLINRIVAPLNRFKKLAQELASGEASLDADTVRGGEFADIIRALSNFVKNSRNLNQEISMEKNLFRLQAEQSASELTAKDEELSRMEHRFAESKEQIRKMASYDRITELPNRGLFIEHVNRLLRLAERDDSHTALLCFSLVNFDRIQESLGRNTGDLLLKEVSKRLVGCLRASDMLGHYLDTNQSINVSRLAGDEFAIVLNRLSTVEDAGEVAKRITEVISKVVKIAGNELFAQPIIGIAVAPRDGTDAERLLNHASAAKQYAAISSTTSFLYFTQQMETGDGDEFKLTPALRRAMARNEFSLHYQPQINATYGSVTSAEALLRWEHPEHGQVSPFKFVPLAEESGLIIELGNWVLVEACRQLRQFRDQGLELPRIALNISPQQLTQDFPLRVRETLKQFELDASSLELGLSEDILARDDGRALYILMDLKSIGVHLSLENFGTTPSSFVYVSRYPLDDIKIDRGFVADCDQREDAARLVNAVIAMASSLGLETVAEGVETTGEYRYLMDKGVRVMRGYLFSKPIPAEHLAELVNAPWHFLEQIQTIKDPALEV